MSDRIAVLSEGELQQVGTPKEIYESPQNMFVANFIGETNLLKVNVNQIKNGQANCELSGGINITCAAAQGVSVSTGHISIRPEQIRICEANAGSLKGKVLRQTYLGTDIHVNIKIDDTQIITVRMQNLNSNLVPDVGEIVGLSFGADAARLLVD